MAISAFLSPDDNTLGRHMLVCDPGLTAAKTFSPAVVKLQNELLLLQEATEPVTTQETQRARGDRSRGKEQSSNLSDIQGTLKKEYFL